MSSSQYQDLADKHARKADEILEAFDYALANSATVQSFSTRARAHIELAEFYDRRAQHVTNQED